MKKIKKGIVISEDIKRILEGVNAFNYKYDAIPNEKTIKSVRENLKKQLKEIFNEVSIISEEEMSLVNRLISGDYPHCNIR